MKISVAIVTLGRPDILADAMIDLARQTRPPDRKIISAVVPDDVGASIPVGVELLFGNKGTTTQRNTVLDAMEDEDVVLFVDDDFRMAPDFLSKLEALFSDCPDVCVATGDVLADGIGGPGISEDQARDILDHAIAVPGATPIDVNNGYGCNMAFRCAPIRTHNLRFDESLPLYGWLEDIDFSRRVAAHGRCVRATALRGVHLGTKGGRTSGLRLGYSQIANPVYLVGRATMRRGHALRMICRNIAANAAKSLRPEPWVDRRGRLRGNLLALVDLMRGRINPQRVLNLHSHNDRA
jgi:GT2 family glycosyltransferase